MISKFILFLFVISSAFAGEFTNKQITLTTINSISHEYVYNPYNTSYKLSELIWDAKDTKMLGFNTDYILDKKSSLQFNYKINISDDAQMDDYDWLKQTPLWSHWSTHPSTKLTKFSILDLTFRLNIKSKSSVKKRFLIGYKIEQRGFKAYDGKYTYSSDNGFRDIEGYFNGLGITYTEEFITPYLGIDVKKEYKNIILSGNITYSPQARAKNSDTHHLRYFTNKNTFSDTTMLSIKAQAEYPINDNFSLALNYKKVKYDEASGYTTRTYYEDTYYKDANNNTILRPKGTVYRYPGAGISNSYDTLNISFIGKF